MRKIFKIGFVLIIALFLLGGGILGVGKARAVEKCDPVCSSGYICAYGVNEQKCIPLAEGECKELKPDECEWCNDDIKTIQESGKDFQYTYGCNTKEQYACKIGGGCEKVGVSSQNNICQYNSGQESENGCHGIEKGRNCIANPLHEIPYALMGQTGCSGSNACGFEIIGGATPGLLTKTGLNTTFKGCVPLQNNECIPGFSNCAGFIDEKFCGIKKGSGNLDYQHGCIVQDTTHKSLCKIAGENISGGCTEIMDISNNNGNIYYNDRTYPFTCGEGNEPKVVIDEKNKPVYIVITKNPADSCVGFSNLKFKEKIEWSATTYVSISSKISLSDQDIQTLLKSQCIGPLADGCKGKSAIQQWLTSTFGNVILTILSVIFGIFHTLFGILLALIMSVMGWVISSFDVTAVSALSTFWAYIRDLCNLLFIVILLYIAFATVLRLNTGAVKKMLPSFLLAAILINFSKQIAFIILDVGEFFTQTLIKLLPHNWSTASGLMSGISEAAGVKNWFMPPLKLDRDFADFAPVLGGLIIGIIFQFVFILAVGLATVLLVVRIVVLWLLIIVSPLPYAALATGMPSLKGFLKKWWDWFLKAVFFAPAMIFCLVVAVALLTDKGAMGDPELVVYQNQNEVQESLDPRIQGANASQDLYAAESSQSNFQQASSGIDAKAQAAASLEGVSMEGMLRLLLATVFIFAGLSAAKMASSFGAGFAVQGADKLMNKAKGAAMKWGVKKPGKAIGKLATGTGSAVAMKTGLTPTMRKLRKGAEEVPVIGRAFGGPGASEKARRKSIEAKAKDLDGFTADDLHKRLKQWKPTAGGQDEKVAIMEKLAEMGELKEENKQDLSMLKQYGTSSSMKTVLKNNPHWGYETKEGREYILEQTNQGKKSGDAEYKSSINDEEALEWVMKKITPPNEISKVSSDFYKHINDLVASGEEEIKKTGKKLRDVFLKKLESSHMSQIANNDKSLFQVREMFKQMNDTETGGARGVLERLEKKPLIKYLRQSAGNHILGDLIQESPEDDLEEGDKKTKAKDIVDQIFKEE